MTVIMMQIRKEVRQGCLKSKPKRILEATKAALNCHRDMH